MKATAFPFSVRLVLRVFSGLRHDSECVCTVGNYAVHFIANGTDAREGYLCFGYVASVPRQFFGCTAGVL